MSTPVVISVTQCSTCTRVFISRKKYSGSLALGGREQPLDRARADVVDGFRRVHADLADALAHLRVDDPLGRRGLLDHLLVAALDRAVALAEVDHVAVAVGEHLHLDVTRVVQVALQVHGRVGEELLAFAAGALEGALQLVLGERHAEALAAAAAGRLDRDREADLGLGDAQRVRDRGDRLGRARHDRHARRLHQLASARLRAHRLDRARRRADEHDARVLARLRERRVLGEEAVAGMDRLGAGARRHVEDLLDAQVVVRRRAVAEVVSLVGTLDVRSVAVELRVHGDAGDAQLVERAHDAHCDLAAIGYEYLAEHRPGSGSFSGR